MSITAEISETTRLRLANEIMELFEHWRVSLEDQISLLGLGNEIKKRHLYKLGEDMPLPNDEGVLLRAEHLVGSVHCSRYIGDRATRTGRP